MKTLRAYTAYLILSVVLICLTVFGATPLWAAESESDQTASYSVSVSSEGQKAIVDDSPYAADEFSRANKGTNREIDGVYRGYAYIQPHDNMTILIDVDSFVAVSYTHLTLPTTERV